MQWLGWSKDWSAPPEHSHDWLDEATNVAQRMGL